ncbi:MAG: SIMPL domain-containing protein, partial [Candidatus Beckwithbacteria bacterium]
MKKLLNLVAIIIILTASCLLIPWEHVNWGKISILPAATITVTGEAKVSLATQIARFSAGVTVFNKDKQTAIDEVNLKMAALIKAVKDFGISEADIQTQNVSVNEVGDQAEIMIYPPRTQSKGWQATNSVSIVLRQIDQASKFTDLLASLEATDVSGPYFAVDDTTQAQTELLTKAIDNAREKAGQMAQASGRKLGKVITVSEGYTSNPGPLYRSAGMDMAVSPPVEPGSETITQTVTVTFELK